MTDRTIRMFGPPVTPEMQEIFARVDGGPVTGVCVLPMGKGEIHVEYEKGLTVLFEPKVLRNAE